MFRNNVGLIDYSMVGKLTVEGCVLAALRLFLTRLFMDGVSGMMVWGLRLSVGMIGEYLTRAFPIRSPYGYACDQSGLRR